MCVLLYTISFLTNTIHPFSLNLVLILSRDFSPPTRRNSGSAISSQFQMRADLISDLACHTGSDVAAISLSQPLHQQRRPCSITLVTSMTAAAVGEARACGRGQVAIPRER
jgi:hypothetical protein